MLLCIILADVLVIFVDVNKRIKDIQIGGQEIKIINFVNETTIFREILAPLPKWN